MVLDWASSTLSSAGARAMKSATRQSSSSRKTKSTATVVAGPAVEKGSSEAPHPIPKGKENVPCPISGMFLSAPAPESDEHSTPEEARRALDQDPDIVEERLALKQALQPIPRALPAAAAAPRPFRFVPMEVVHGAHRPSAATRQLVLEIGGIPTLRRFTNKFYQRAFADPHIDRFIADQSEPHGDRFANWIAEKLGLGTPWTEERRSRPVKYMHFGNEVIEVSHDRSSSHFAAWYSPKREPEKMGEHFKPDDARVWMRLHFWAARETGLFDEHPSFMDYYMRFIGHFISVYSSKAPPFTRESARWSAQPENIQRYTEQGNRMRDVIGKDVALELQRLPVEERLYTGSRHPSPSWPYGGASHSHTLQH